MLLGRNVESSNMVLAEARRTVRFASLIDGLFEALLCGDSRFLPKLKLHPEAPPETAPDSAHNELHRRLPECNSADGQLIFVLVHVTNIAAPGPSTLEKPYKSVEAVRGNLHLASQLAKKY